MTDNLKQILKTIAPPPTQVQSTDPLVGSRLNNEYHILQLLGQGAMAKVYKARQVTLDRTVAIKILTSEAPDLVARFIHEIKVHSSLKHTNIVEALDCVTDMRTGQTCFIMEYLDGSSLQQVVRANTGGFKSEEDILFVASQMAAALNYAHRQGVIHRDLKPANLVFVESHGQLQVKVVDFGMARLQEQLQRFTKTGHIVGSPLYMSPEQCMGKELDARSDVYALALVTYEMATGKAPFADAASLYDVMQCHCDPDKRPTSIANKNPTLRLSQRLEDVINTALQTNPDQRFQTVKLFEDALRSWYDSVEKGLTQEEVDLKPIERGSPPTTEEVDTSKSIDSLPALMKRSQAAAPRVPAEPRMPAAPPSAEGAPVTGLAGMNLGKSAAAAGAVGGAPMNSTGTASTTADDGIPGAAAAPASAGASTEGANQAKSATAPGNGAQVIGALPDPSTEAQSVAPAPLLFNSGETAQGKGDNAAAPAKAVWRIPEMVTTHHGGGWGVVDGQELNMIRQSEPMIGRLLNNRYRVQELIGEGGMSVVYRAEDKETGKMVAVKSLKFVDAELAERFSREINLHMELKHPNIVRAIERISTYNQTFFVMELLTGTVLEDYLEREFNISSFNDICSILSQICDALEFAHDQDVIHRDLKPGNVMLADQAGLLRVKVLDFGLAQIQDDLQRMTRTGILVGSPGYMSPEHCLGLPLTCQSDIYSLGILAFEIIAGELPYESETDIGIMKAHCDKNLRALPISKFRQDLPAIEELEKVLACALEKDQTVRYAAIEDFRRGLNGWWLAAGGGAEESPFKERRRRRKRVRSQTGIPAATATGDQTSVSQSGTAVKEKDLVAEKENLDSLVDKQRQSRAETVTAKWRADSRFDGGGRKNLTMVVITILIFCVMGTVVWLSNNKPREKPAVQAAQQSVPTTPASGVGSPNSTTSVSPGEATTATSSTETPSQSLPANQQPAFQFPDQYPANDIPVGDDPIKPSPSDVPSVSSSPVPTDGTEPPKKRGYKILAPGQLKY
ncbi:MAG: serine/threonine-protein kinase [Candidatus Melainabacteria bacterium]|nr:serine/threonine-protein kinase [Candidatus Melainabacteria bacterium]